MSVCWKESGWCECPSCGPLVRICDLCPNPATHGHLCIGCAWSEDVAKYQGDSE